RSFSAPPGPRPLMSQSTRTGRSAPLPFDRDRTSGDGRGRDPGPLEPGLEHEHVPQVVLVVPPAGQVLGPPDADRAGLEVSLVAQAGRVEQLLGPGPKRSA